MKDRPNIIFVFADQWRAQAFGYAGDPNVKTPNIDRFAEESLNFDYAISGCPVCTPYRASLMTGVYPNKHKLMVNDQCLYDRYDGPFLAECLNDAGYETAYIGKWHIDGKGRNAFVPQERRLGFKWWKGFECTHDYQDSYYYFGDDERPHKWEGYDADSQTDEACRFLREEVSEKPFALFISWGPPHNPFGNAPEEFEAMYDPAKIKLPANVPDEYAAEAAKELAGYYAHCSALDAAFGRLMDEVTSSALADDTIVIFTSDHGDMLGSHGMNRKQKPWAESNRVPFLVRHPLMPGKRIDHTPIDAPDIMPTILSLVGAPVPEEVQGADCSSIILEGKASGIEYALLALYSTFHEWTPNNGGREYRGLFNKDYTYVRSLDGPWLLYDNQTDVAQFNNLVEDESYLATVKELDSILTSRLQSVGDTFDSGPDIIAKEGYALNKRGDILITPSELPEPHKER